MNTKKSVVMILSAVSTVLTAVSTQAGIYDVPASLTQVVRLASVGGDGLGAANSYEGTNYTLDGTLHNSDFSAAGKWNDSVAGNSFLAFQLPALGGGETITSVTFTLQFSGSNGGASLAGLALYGMGLNSSDLLSLDATGTIAAFGGYFGLTGSTANPQEGTLLSASILGTNPNVAWTVSTVDVTAYITGLYAGYDGDDYVVLRTSLLQDIGTVPSNNRVHFGGLGMVNDNFTTFPQLTITTAAVPEPSTYAALLGALALAGMVVRRHRKVK